MTFSPRVMPEPRQHDKEAIPILSTHSTFLEKASVRNVIRLESRLATAALIVSRVVIRFSAIVGPHNDVENERARFIIVGNSGNAVTKSSHCVNLSSDADVDESAMRPIQRARIAKSGIAVIWVGVEIEGVALVVT
mmetsp:Transcript_24791/g.52573  ORF Transcript_24791/g.52573 Transcript_24791/m.52573 type:complete len:136 (-) Transcript_24791:703-1110(-)